MSENTFSYILELRSFDQKTHRLSIEEKLSIGSSESCDLVFPDLSDKLDETHLVFKKNAQVLSLLVKGKKSPCVLDGLELGPGKMYVLENGDRLEIASLTLTIRKAPLSEIPDLVSTPPGENTIIRLIDQEIDKDYQQVEAPKAPEPTLAPKKKKVKNKKSIFTALKDFFKKKKKKKIKKKLLPPKKDSKSENHYGFFKRLLALFLHLGIFYLFFYDLIDRFNFRHFVEKLTAISSPFIDSFKNLLNPLVKDIPFSTELIDFLFNKSFTEALLVFLTLDLVFHLILSRSLPQFILGVKDQRSALKRYIFAPVRFLLHYLSFPLLLLHLPIFFRRRPFHELITGTYLSSYKNPLRYLGPLLLAPILILLCLSLPALFRPEFFNSLKIKSFQEPEKTHFTEEGEEQVLEGGFIFPLVELKTKISPDIFFLPFMEDNELKLNVFNPNTRESLSLSFLAPLSLSFIQESLKRSLPLAHKIYPEIFNEDDRQESMFNNQLNALTKDSLKLSHQSILSGLKNFGPFFSGPLNLKKEILALTNSHSFDSLSLIKKDREEFILVENARKSCFLPALIHHQRGLCLSDKKTSSKLFSSFYHQIFKELKKTKIDRAPAHVGFHFFNSPSSERLKSIYPQLTAYLQALGLKLLSLESIPFEQEFKRSLSYILDLYHRYQLDSFELEKISDAFHSQNKEALTKALKSSEL